MAEWIEPMEWANEGVEPSDSLKETGFQAKYKPPAGTFNYFLHKYYECTKQLQDEVDNRVEKVEGKGLSTNDYTNEEKEKLGKIDGTPDSEKSVKFASEASVARKTQYALSVRFNGGSTEGVDKWTFDGNTSRSINITPDKIGAAEKNHLHTLDGISETESKKIKRLAVANSTDGVTYTATVEGVTELYNGMEITIIPDKRSTSKTVTLNINELGAVPVRQPLSFSTFVATAPDRESFLYEEVPCRLMYHANYTSGGIWLMADKQKTSAQDLYGTVPVRSGGTGCQEVDTQPKSGSQAMVTSNGIYNVLTGVIPFQIKATYDSEGNDISKTYLRETFGSQENYCNANVDVGIDENTQYVEVIPNFPTKKSAYDIFAAVCKMNDGTIIQGFGYFGRIYFSGHKGFKLWDGIGEFGVSNGSLVLAFQELTYTDLSRGETDSPSSVDIDYILVYFS